MKKIIEPTQTSRRDFLKTTAAVTAGGLILPNAFHAFSQETATPQTRDKLIGTKTEKNLLTAFAGESQARNRYSFYAEQARKDGFHQIAAIFEETAGHEREHAKRFYSFLKGGKLEIQSAYPAGIVSDDTAENLESAAEGEHEEWAILYPESAKIADEEGFPQIAALFNAVCIAEKMHEERYRALKKNIEEDRVFEREEKVWWVCRNCGYVIHAKEASTACPACRFAQAYFQLFVPSW